MNIGHGEHVCVVGINGTGKTFYCRNGLLPSFARIIVVDTEEMDFEDFPSVSVKTALRLVRSDYAFVVRIVVYPDDMETIEELSRGLLSIKRRDCATAVYFDEITDFSDPARIPPELKKLIRKGRKRDLHVIVGTQRPQDLHKEFLANSVHRVIFYISDYDQAANLKKYAPEVEERMGEIPWKSYRSFYQSPSGNLTLQAPCKEYQWSKRLHPQR